MKKNLKKGFTLVELVIVIAVIGILAAILIPTFTGVTSEAKYTSSLSEARTELTNYMVAEGGEIADDLLFEVDGYYFIYADGGLTYAGDDYDADDAEAAYDTTDDLTVANTPAYYDYYVYTYTDGDEDVKISSLSDLIEYLNTDGETISTAATTAEAEAAAVDNGLTKTKVEDLTEFTVLNDEVLDGSGELSGCSDNVKVYGA